MRVAPILLLTLLIAAPTAQAQNAQYTAEEWRSAIDAQWGAGDETSLKLRVFDAWWNEINLRFGGFHGIDLDIQEMRSRYRPEVQAGVTAGRFSGIMTHFTFGLKELHTYLWDNRVRNTPMNRGVPMMVVGSYGDNRRFGANLSVLPDSTLLVYEAVPNHPAGLVPGDVVIGFDGERWVDIYPRLLDAELPLFLNPVHGNTDEVNYYYLMQAAGLNWHLFETMDVVKYASGETVQIPTSQLAGQTATIWGKDQIAPPGVPWPDRSAGDRVGWGVIDGTNIGMVTVTSWAFDAQFDIRARFEQAVDEMMHVNDLDGIIFDFRFNTGGGALAREGLQLLFNTDVPTVGFDRRVTGGGHLEMEPDPSRREFNLVIRGDPATYFDKPIAILIGPGSISAGELEARRMSFHPEARVFGLPAAGGNTGSDFISLGHTQWFVSRANSAQYLVSNHEYLTHSPLLPDERVWFTQEDAANGVDTVIEAAKSWILTETTAIELPAESDLDLSVYPNPASSVFTATLSLEQAGRVQMTLFDSLGRRVGDTWSSVFPAGVQRRVWRSDVALGPGVYFLHLETEQARVVRSVVVTR